MLYAYHTIVNAEKEGKNMIAENSMEYSSDGLCSYLLFCIAGHIFSVETKDVFKIQKADTSILALPNMPAYIRGSFKTADELFYVVDLCQMFGWKTPEQKFQEFSEMLEARKRDHVNWVDELRKSYTSGTPFALSRNHHDCTLGIWRDNYIATNPVIQHLLTYLDEPHEKLHKLAADVLKYDEYSSLIMNEIETEWKPRVLRVLDKMRSEFEDLLTREIYILICGTANLAIAVDSVLCIEPIQNLSICSANLINNHESFLKNVFQRTTDAELIMELDIAALIKMLHMEKEMDSK